MYNRPTATRTGISVCLAIALGLFASVGTAANAAPILDQENVISLGDGFAAGEDNAQTFTVGAGGILTSIHVFLRNATFGNPGADADLLFDVRKTTGTGAPEESNSAPEVLGSLAVSAFALPTAAHAFHIFDLSAFNISVDVGDELAFVLRGDYSLPIKAFGSSYAGGERYLRNLGTITSWVSAGAGSQDAGFRTFVDSSAQSIDESNSLAILALGLAGLAFVRRKRSV